MARLRDAASRAIFACAMLLPSIHAAAEPQNGWWWNPNESGRGYFIEVSGGVFYLAGYFYESNGRATWMSAGGAVTDLYSLSGTLQSYRNGQSIFGAYRRPDPAVDVGTISITFKDDSHGTITWPGGTVPIERQVFDTDEALFDPPKTGWWWNPAEGGSGYSVEIQGNTLFVVAFMYDEAGNPLWYLTAGALSSPTHFEGDWLEYSGGQTMAGPYRAPTARNLGRVTIDFAAFDDATITFTEGATVKRLKKNVPKASKAAAGARSRSTRAQPQLPTPTWSTTAEFWPHFVCDLTQKIVTISEAGTTGTFTSTKTYAYYVTFDLLPGTLGRYVANAGQSSYEFSYNTVDTSNGCRQSAHRENITPLSGQLDISPYLYYSGRVFDSIGSSVTVHESCPPPNAYEADEVGRILVENPIAGRSVIQRPNPFPSPPPPYMHVVNSHAEPDGSSIEWGWECIGSSTP
ncbi:MAG TPA: hypothetical protein VGL25_19320 [Casimicrobiaceae bacterium]